MKKLDILHISDVHIQKKNEIEIREITQKLIYDIEKVQEHEDLTIDLVCFTGDLIQRGDNALKEENQWNLAIEIFIEPLLKKLNLSMEDFIFIPGNHEVDIEKIDKIVEKGLKQINSIQDMNELMNNLNPFYRERLSYFYDIVKRSNDNVILGKLGYSYRKQINSLNIGIACVDSAWRSSGKGAIEKGEIYVGSTQIQELFYNIEDCDIKICMMHHPIDWLKDFESLEVEKELSNFDIVLRGHVHEEDMKEVIRRNMKTIYSTAGKLYPLDYADGNAVDGYNGYSILNIDYDKCKCNIYIRSYYGRSRKEFDAGINICSEGKESYDIFLKDNNWQLEYDIIKGIKNYFCDMSEKYTLIKEADTKSPQNYLQVMIDPVLSDKSEYVNEEEKEISIQDIVLSNNNILLIGKKESGKTTILQQIGLRYLSEYDIKGYIPIYINMKYLPKGNDRILNSIIHFIHTNILEKASISKKQIKQILDDGKFILLIDDVNSNDTNHTLWLSKFINEYGQNRFILTLNEDFFQVLDVKELPDYGLKYEEIYIHYMGKRQIREMVTQWTKGRENVANIDETVNRIDLYCNQINFAKTPFNIAVFMVIWDVDNRFIPVNEGVIMRNFLDIVLEKLSPDEAYRKTYSFVIKQDFLSYLAHEMYLKDEYYITTEEFNELLIEYHQRKGYILSESKFDKIFFEKNILSNLEDYVVFSHSSFLEYFLAFYAYNNEMFLEEMLKEGKRIFFKNEICFYAGLNQDCTKLLDNLSDSILETIIYHIELVEDLNDMEILAEFKIDRGKFIEDIQKNRPSQEELDIKYDESREYKVKHPKEITKRDTNKAESLFSLLQMYGSVIKNAELLDNNLKIMHLENYMYGMNMLYAVLIKLFEFTRDKMEYDELEDSGKKLLGVNSKEEFEQFKANAIDFSKLMFPIAIQNMILENVGTPKLGIAINELIKKKQDKPFEKFMLAFLKCDLKIVNLKSLLGKYIKEEKSSGILKIMLMKLTFYYRMRFFGNDKKIDKILIDLITDIEMKLNPQRFQNFYKSKIAQDTKIDLDRKK